MEFILIGIILIIGCIEIYVLREDRDRYKQTNDLLYHYNSKLRNEIRELQAELLFRGMKDMNGNAEAMSVMDRVEGWNDKEEL